MWTMLGPVVLLALISALYFLSGTHSILNMDVPTFSMIGATTWIMFRTVIFRSAASFHGARWLINIRPFSPLMVGLTQGAMYLCAFGVVFPVLITGGNIVGLFDLPNDGLATAFWIVCVGIFALAIGVIFGSVAVVWPYFLRFAPVIERSLQLVSSVIFVSEQLPMDLRPYVLWSPLAHAMQLLRSAYFAGYKSDDANAEYFFMSLGLLIVTAILVQGSVRWRSAPM
jgi:capsular polysaccharide transport system permease protein